MTTTTLQQNKKSNDKHNNIQNINNVNSYFQTLNKKKLNKDNITDKTTAKTALIFRQTITTITSTQKEE